MAPRPLDRLIALELYAYGRWLRSRSGLWYRLAAACVRAHKAHPGYSGA